MSDGTGPVGPADQRIGIEFRQITKRFGGPDSPLVIQGVDLKIPKGTLTTILGPSGCGKTTLLRMIAGLETQTSGRVFIDGEDVTELGPAERNVSMVFQSYALFPHMSVRENVAYGLKVARMNVAEMNRRLTDAMNSVGLSGYESRMPNELSGGQQQRVAVARALVLEPSVMLFDEPLSNLDARLRRSMRDEIRQLQQRLGLTVAYVTHDQSEALAVSDQVVVMNQGRIAQAGTPRELYERPVDSFVAGFMGEAMLFDGVSNGSGTVQVGPLSIDARGAAGTAAAADAIGAAGAAIAPSAASAKGAVKVAVRPEAWAVAEASVAGNGAMLPGQVRSVAYLGSHLEVVVETQIGSILVIVGDTKQGFEIGQAVSLRPRSVVVARA